MNERMKDNVQKIVYARSKECRLLFIDRFRVDLCSYLSPNTVKLIISKYQPYTYSTMIYDRCLIFHYFSSCIIIIVRRGLNIFNFLV